MKKITILVVITFAFLLANAQTNKFVSDLKQKGEEPLTFVNKIFEEHDLIIFDDALHNAYEPFVFYNEIINDKRFEGKLNYIFLETIGIEAQPAINKFLNAKTCDSTLLIKVFQDDYSGYGWRYQTYLDLFKNVWKHNQNQPDSLKIQIFGVNPPIYWEAIKTWEDYEIFQNSLKSRDYALYLEILEKMENFSSNKKGIFLTNTRHAYKNIKDAKGNIYWETTTFFNHWNPGKTYSIRLHNVNLLVQAKKVSIKGERKSTEGLDQNIYSWVKIDNGNWDNAFEKNGNKPVAIPLRNTSFGKTPYIGNRMLNVAKNTTMHNAYDAVIFLKPLEELHFSAKFNYIYTPEFSNELERRLKILKGDEYNEFLQSVKVSNFQEYYNNLKSVPISKNTLVR